MNNKYYITALPLALIHSNTIAGIKWEPEPDWDPEEIGSESGFSDFTAFIVLMAIVLVIFGKIK